MASELPPVLMDSYFVKEMSRSREFGGFDGLVLGNLAAILNFSVVVIEPKSRKDYGYGSQISNDTFSGEYAPELTGHVYLCQIMGPILIIKGRLAIFWTGRPLPHLIVDR